MNRFAALLAACRTPLVRGECRTLANGGDG